MANVVITDKIKSSATAASLDAKYGPYASTTAANAALGEDGDDVITAGLTVGITQSDGSIKEYWYQPDGQGGLELVEKQVAPVSDAVLYTEQELNASQQTQARSNIGAGTSNFSGNYNDLTNKPTIPTVPTISTNIDSDATSDTKTASPKAVKTFVEGKGYLTQHQDISGKVDKVANATENDFVAFDANGGIKDSGKKASDFATAAQGAKADTAVQSVSVDPNTVTGNAGTNASVTNTGTQTAPVLKFTIPRGADAVNPFKGWLTSTNDLPNNPHVGDYAYVEDSGTTYVYRCTTEGTWPTTSTEEKEPSSATFATAQLLNNTKIDDTHLVNPIGSDETNNPTLAKAEDVMQLKAKLEGVTASETKVVDWQDWKPEGQTNSGYYNTSNEWAGNTNNYKSTRIDVSEAKKVRFLGYATNSTLVCFALLKSDGTFVAGYPKPYLDTSLSALELREYVIEVPSDAKYLVALYQNGTSGLLQPTNFYCYLQSGETILDMMPQIDDSLESDDAKNALSAKQGNIIANTTMQLVKSLNLLNPDTIVANGKILRKDYGIEYSYSGAYGYTDYIELTQEGLICNSCCKSTGVIAPLVCYNANKQIIANLTKNNGTDGSAISITPTGDYANVKYVRFNLYTRSDGNYAVYRGTSLPQEFVPYFAPFWAQKPANIADGAVSTSKLANDAVTLDKVSFKTSIHGKNLVDVSLIEKGYYTFGGYRYEVGTSENYYLSDKISVEAGKQYYLSLRGDIGVTYGTGSVYICFFNDGTFVSNIASNSKQFTVPENANQVGFTIQKSQISQGYESTYGEVQLEEGTSRTEYEEYWSKVVIKEDVLPERSIEDNSVTTPKIADGAVTQSKLSSSVTIPASPLKFNGWVTSGTGIAPSGNLTLDKYFRCRKGFQTSAIIKGAIGSISYTIGTSLSVGFTLTNENLVVGGTNYPHGLMLGEFTTIVVNMGDDKNITSNTKIIIIDDSGHSFEKTNVDLRLFAGNVKVTNNNSTGNIDVVLSAFNKDLAKKIWMFGDSYFSYIDPARWIYQIMQWGYDNYLLDAEGGKTATDIYNDLGLLLESGAKPSYVVWCLGMNGGADSNGEVNPTWLSVTQQVISICQNIGSELILATIPSIPNASHVELNEWVRNSGYRYIDFAAAVEDGVGVYPNYWRLWGDDTTTPASGSLLSSDKVHPTQYGAVELAARVLIDFPEITIIGEK